MNRRDLTAVRAAVLCWAAAFPGCGTDEAPPSQTEAVPVGIASVTERTFVRRLAAQGTMLSRTTCTVAALVDGTLSAIAVDEGDRVEAGSTLLFRTDSVLLERSRDLARQAVAVALLSTKEKEANLARVAAEHEQARRDHERYGRLYRDDKAVSAVVFEQAETHFAAAEATKRHAEALLALAREQELEAALALAMAEKRLADATVTAPVTGVVQARMKEPNEFAGAGDPVLSIADTGRLEVHASLPSAHYAAVVPGTTAVAVEAGEGRADAAVAYKSPTIDERLRTFLVKILIDGDGRHFVPGALCAATFDLERRTGCAVPADAVVMRADGASVFVKREGVVLKVPIEPGLRQEGFVEVRGGELRVGDDVVVRGQEFLSDGAAVRLESRPPAARGDDAQESP